jgi:hypothetical protein
VSIAAGAMALAIAVSPMGHAAASGASGTGGDHPPRTKAQRIAHHQHVVHHRQVVKQRIRARQHPMPTPTPTPVPTPPVATPTPAKPTPVTVKPHAPTRQVVVHVPHRVTRVQPKPMAVAPAPVRHHASAPVARVAPHALRPELTAESAAAPLATQRPVVRPHATTATPAEPADAPAIVTVPRHVVQYVRHQFASMLPAVQIGFGVICVLGLFMMGYAVAIGRRPTA